MKVSYISSCCKAYLATAAATAATAATLDEAQEAHHARRTQVTSHSESDAELRIVSERQIVVITAPGQAASTVAAPAAVTSLPPGWKTAVQGPDRESILL
jgi:hypothetical protein